MRCGCGSTMIGNGVRRQSVSHVEGEVFSTENGMVRRLRCPSCGSSVSHYDPEREPGFRISRKAADRMVDLALARGLTACAEASGVDRATVSRLLAARSDRLIAETKRPDAANLSVLENGAVGVADAYAGAPVAFFRDASDHRLQQWLSVPRPAIILPDAQIAPRTMGWSNFLVALPVDQMRKMLAPMFQRARMAFNRLLCAGRVSPGSERHFDRTCERLHDAMAAHSVLEGKKAVSRWIASLDEAWAAVFSPVIGFLRTYDSAIFSHPLCMRPFKPSFSLVPRGPANVMTLSLRNGQLSTGCAGQALRPQY